MNPVTADEVCEFLREGGYDQDDPSLPEKVAAKCNETGVRDIWEVWRQLFRESRRAVELAAELRIKRLYPNDEDLIGYTDSDDDDSPPVRGYHDPRYIVERDYEGEKLDYEK